MSFFAMPILSRTGSVNLIMMGGPTTRATALSARRLARSMQAKTRWHHQELLPGGGIT